MKTLLLNALCLLVFISATGQESLFNGKNLDGWTLHGTELWYVEDGLLICESGPERPIDTCQLTNTTMTLN